MGGARELFVCAMCICACAHDHMHKFNVSKFSLYKKICRKIFHQPACIDEIGESFLHAHTHLDSNLESQVGNSSVLTDGTQLENSRQKSAALSENEEEY